MSVALADETPSTTEISTDLLQDAVDSPDTGEAQLTDPQAAEELPHRDLGREEAVELTEAVFDPILEDAVGPIQGLEVERYLSDNAAIVPSGASSESPVEINSYSSDEQPQSNSGEPVLLESTLPLRTEGPQGGKEPVDLSLEVTGGALEPKAPLVAVELPQEIGEGIQLPEVGIGIDLPEAPSERAPSIVNETVAAYPNVATDTDFSAVPTPTGFETLTTLRSPDAPHAQTFQLSLPPGATLRQVDEGAEVEQDGKTILKVLPPSAIDAAGANVPVSLDVNGNSLVLTAIPDASTQFPVLVDPLFEAYDWYYLQTQTGQNTWYPASNSSGMEYSQNSSGLFLKARHEFPYSNGSQISWSYYVPRYKAEQAQGRTPTSFLQRLTLWHLAFVTQPGGTFAPYMFAGIWGSQGWAGKPGGQAVWSYAGNSPPFYGNAPGNGMLVEFENGEPGKRDQTAKEGIFGLASTEYVPPTTQTRFAAAGAAAVEVGDEDKPGTANGSVSSSWVNQTANAPLTATAEDTGLGVQNIGFDLPWKGPIILKNDCSGTVSSPCSLNWTASLPVNQYNPAEMPQGFVYIPVSAEDVLGNKATPGATKALVKVDHTAPSLALSGSITEQAKLGTKASQYALKYNAADGEDTAAEALTPFGTAGTGEGKMQRPMGVAIDASGNAFVVDRECKCVQKYDPTGKFLSQFGTSGSGNGQFLDPRAIAISPADNIWVSDISQKRVQQFNPSGGFIRSITSPQFSEPYAVATGPGGVLWVSDIGKDKLFKFSETGGSLGQSAPLEGSAIPFASPVGLTVEASGRVWASDNGTNRITLLDSSGNYINQFGSEGTGNGQFKGPIGIAIAPSGHVLVADDLNNRVQVFQPTGSYLRQFGSTGTANNQLKEPRGIAIGSGNALYVADAGNKRIAKWSHADQDPQSGVTKVEIKVDGQLVKTPYNQACATKNCLTNGEWIYKSSDYTTGQHKVDVIATDGVNLPTTKTVTINTVKDTTAPELKATNNFFIVPEGWVEQISYPTKPSALDPNGYGVISLALKIDGAVVKSATQTCANGGCGLSLSGSIDMAQYDGGAHPAELIATDGAGNTTKKVWTVNVDPAGNVDTGEVTDTLKAMEDTAEELQPVAPTSEFLEPEIIEAGDNPHFQADAESIDSTGVPTSTSIDLDTGTVTIDGADVPIEITPINAQNHADTEVEAGVAAVTPNYHQGVDRVVRPEYNGALFFTEIRTLASPESFSWRVNLQPGQTLRLVDDQHAEVIFEDGNRMSLITTMQAHDATGAAVPTHLVVDGSTVTLFVSHRTQSYVYPVAAGEAFEVGYSSVFVELPVTEEEAGDIQEEEEWGNEPLSPAEFADATGWLLGGAPQRSGNKPVTMKQAKRIAKVNSNVTKVPPPAIPIIGGPGGNGPGGSEVTWHVHGRMCSDFNCDIWAVEFAPETKFVIANTGSQAGGVQYAAPYGPTHCGGDVMFWWRLNLSLNTIAAGTRGPTTVQKGSGEYLTFWCKYNVTIFPIPEVLYFDAERTLVTRVYANGFQVFYARNRNTWLQEN